MECLVCDHTVSLWLDCDETNVKKYSQELAEQVWQEGIEIVKILPKHVSQEEINVSWPGEGTLDEVINTWGDPTEDKPAEWFLERGFVSSFGSM